VYDKVTIYIPENQLKTNPKSFIKDLKEKKITEYNPQIGERFLIKDNRETNIRVKSEIHGIVLDGSLPKFYFGHNLKNIELFQVNEALAKISELIGVNLDNCTIRLLEVGFNIETKYKPTTYLKYFGDKRGKNGKWEFNDGLPQVSRTESLKYKNKEKWITLYDKVKEAKANKHSNPFPKEYDGKKIMRIEATLKSKMMKKLFGQSLKVKDLTNSDVINQLLEYYYLEFKDIRQLPEQGIPFTGNNMMEVLAAESDYNLWEERLTAQRERGVITSQQKYNSLKRIRDAKAKAKPSNHMKEINDKLESVLTNFQID